MKNCFFTILLMLCMPLHAAAHDWMRLLPDHLYITQVSLPGTHDTATGNGVSLAAFSQCQDLSLDKQWSIGIRAFDLRPKVKDGYLNNNHGIAETKLRFDDALRLLRDSLKAHPTEFAVIHCLYAQDYDTDKDTYAQLLKALVTASDLKDVFVPFRRNLTVGDMRGKILLLSRQDYAAKPYTGGFLRNWCGTLDWQAQTSCSILGPSATITGTSPLYVQDMANTTDDNGGVQRKVEAVTQLLDWSTTHTTTSFTTAVWVINFASAYPGSISTANGYRDNATHTNAAIIDYLKTHEPGPTGVILMDYCVDKSGTYNTRGKELVDTLIANNYKWLERVCRPLYDKATDSLASLRTQLAGAHAILLGECRDVATLFEDRWQAIKTAIDNCRDDVEARYRTWNMKWNFAIDYDSMKHDIDQLIADAREAQAIHDATGIARTTGDTKAVPAATYSIGGVPVAPHATPTRQVVIEKYADGSTRKVMRK